MRKAAYSITPDTSEILRTVGEQIRLARLRRDLTAELVAERAGISRSTLWKVESGEPGVAMGIYAAVLHALNGLDADLLKMLSAIVVAVFLAVPYWKQKYFRSYKGVKKHA